MISMWMLTRKQITTARVQADVRIKKQEVRRNISHTDRVEREMPHHYSVLIIIVS